MSRRLRGGAAISLHRLHPLPLCASVRPWRQSQPQLHCGIPQKHRWAGAATPTQRIATRRTQIPPGKASDMINGTNLLGKDNPRWPNGNATETANFLAGAPGPRTAARRKVVRFLGIALIPVKSTGKALRTACAMLGAQLADVPHRIGAKLFATNDAEAHWHGWDVTELHAGLARSYRDPRFDALQALREAAAQIARQPEEQGGPLP
jgi:hypothetical protein